MKKEYLYLYISLSPGLLLDKHLKDCFGEIIGAQLIEVKEYYDNYGAIHCYFKKENGDEFTEIELNRLKKRPIVLDCQRKIEVK